MFRFCDNVDWPPECVMITCHFLCNFLFFPKNKWLFRLHISKKPTIKILQIVLSWPTYKIKKNCFSRSAQASQRIYPLSLSPSGCPCSAPVWTGFPPGLLNSCPETSVYCSSVLNLQFPRSHISLFFGVPPSFCWNTFSSPFLRKGAW